MWRNYFRFVKLVPGKVVVPWFGTIDFSRDDIPVETCRKLWENDFQYLELTDEGLSALYGIAEESSGIGPSASLRVTVPGFDFAQGDSSGEGPVPQTKKKPPRKKTGATTGDEDE